MKLRILIPKAADLLEAYQKLQNPQYTVTEEEVVSWAQWSRWDPRLMEQVISDLHRNWARLNPILLKKLNDRQAWPQSLAVVLEHVSVLLNSRIFDQWKQLILCDVQPVPYQKYFIGLEPPASPRSLRSARQPLLVFEKWGFLEQEFICSKSFSKPLLQYSKESRAQILNDLLKKKKRIQVSDYLEALQNSISPRQALRDLKANSKVKAVDRSKGRRYVLV